MQKLFVYLLLCHLGLFLLIAGPVFPLDQVVKLYICQTEHDLEEITACEYSDPERYRLATKNGKRTPLDAAQESAGTFVSMDRIQCDSDNRLAIEKYRGEGNSRTPYMYPLEGGELEQYCPRTIKKYSHPCR
jgi:hypothetical protein